MAFSQGCRFVATAGSCRNDKSGEAAAPCSFMPTEGRYERATPQYTTFVYFFFRSFVYPISYFFLNKLYLAHRQGCIRNYRASGENRKRMSHLVIQDLVSKLTNRHIRDPEACPGGIWWCERRPGGQLTVSRLLDCSQLFFIQFNFYFLV